MTEMYQIDGSIKVATIDEAKIHKIADIIADHFESADYEPSQESPDSTEFYLCYYGEAYDDEVETLLTEIREIAQVLSMDVDCSGNAECMRYSLDDNGNLCQDDGELVFSDVTDAAKCWRAVVNKIPKQALMTALIEELGCSEEWAEHMIACEG